MHNAGPPGSMETDEIHINYLMGNIYSKQGNHEKAAESYEKTANLFHIKPYRKGYYERYDYRALYKFLASREINMLNGISPENEIYDIRARESLNLDKIHKELKPGRLVHFGWST